MLKNLKVLFVEDEENIRKSLKKAIGDEFKKFTTACDGEDGLKKFKSEKFDLIISDISMPNLDGLNMTRQIKKTSKSTPIILLSAYSEKEKLLKAIEIGVSRYMIKPIDPEELLNVIKSITEQKRGIKLINQYFYDYDKKILYIKEKEIALTKKELQIVTLLIKNIGNITSKEDIKKHIWSDQNCDDTLLRTLIKRLRDKTDKELIQNIQGFGYKIDKYS